MHKVCLLLLCTVVANATSSVLLTDGETEHQLVPTFQISKTAEIPITDDMRFTCVLSILDLPLGSIDLIDVSQARGIHQLLKLPESVYGNGNFWEDLQNTGIPPIAVLQLLDSDRYKVFESSIPKHYAGLSLLLGTKHLSAGHDIFPKRRLLQTFKTHFQTKRGVYANPFFSLTFVTIDNFIDWSRVFFADRVEHLSDKQIQDNPSLKKAVIRDILYRSTESIDISQDFVNLFECFVFRDKNTPFYVRFEDCMHDLGVADLPSEGMGELYTKIVIRRNELLFRRAFSGKKKCVEEDFIKGVLKLDSARVNLFHVHEHLEKKLVQYKSSITPLHWEILGTMLQTRPEHEIWRPNLVLTIYFMGRVDLLDPFIQTHPAFAHLPVGQPRDFRVNFDPEAFQEHLSAIKSQLSDAIDLATFFDPDICITSGNVASALLIPDNYFYGLSALSYKLINNEPIPETEAAFDRHLGYPVKAFVHEPFEGVIYPRLGLIPRNSLLLLVEMMGFKLLNFLDNDTCTWFLGNVLEMSTITGFSLDLLRNLERQFPSIAAGKNAQWAINLLERNPFQQMLAFRRLVLMVVKNFDLTADLFSWLVRFGATRTEVFVQLFKKIWRTNAVFTCDPEATLIINSVRPGLSRWLRVRFDVKANEQGECSLTRIE